MTTGVEVLANLLTTISIAFAGRNSVHTWWVGIAGSLVFGWLFFQTQLYADATLQVFFVATSLFGWWRWRGGVARAAVPIRRTSLGALLRLTLAGVLVVLGYGALLHWHTDAYAPFVDSGILAFSVLGQLLLMKRRLETWWCWLLVNSLAVPVYWSRGLKLTALLYAAYWIHALVSYRHWRSRLGVT